MTILFLDFDGVLHPERDENPAFFTANAVLHEFLRADPEVMVVFTTTWRNGRSVAELAALVCQGGGEDLLSRFVGKVPDLDRIPQPGAREEECRLWMAKNGWVTSDWMALDDNPDWFVSARQIYAVAPDRGLRPEDVAGLQALACRVRNASKG